MRMPGCWTRKGSECSAEFDGFRSRVRFVMMDYFAYPRRELWLICAALTPPRSTVSSMENRCESLTNRGYSTAYSTPAPNGPSADHAPCSHYAQPAMSHPATPMRSSYI